MPDKTIEEKSIEFQKRFSELASLIVEAIPQDRGHLSQSLQGAIINLHQSSHWVMSALSYLQQMPEATEKAVDAALKEGNIQIRS